MKDAIIIAVCGIILGAAGFFVGGAMTKEQPAAAVDTSKLTGDLKAKAEKAAAPDTDTASGKHTNEMLYGGIGAVVGLAAGAGVSAVVGKKK